MPSAASLLRAGLVALLASIYAPAVMRFCQVLGLFRSVHSSVVDPSDFMVIEDTTHCEDLHHHVPSNTIFTACEDSAATRFSWFPALGAFNDPIKAMTSQGSIHVIDPKTFRSTRLQFENFDGPFVTHGIDVVSDKTDSGAVYIFAVNHVPHPSYVEHMETQGGAKNNFPAGLPKARSQIEMFRHVLGSTTARHVRSIRHPLITTPNDVLALSPTSLYITNDHFYAEGRMRFLEDVYFGAKWSTTVHVQIDRIEELDPTQGFQATIAVTGLHNNNGLGHAASPGEIAISSATSGILHIGRISQDSSTQHKVKILESIPFHSTIDNPSFYRDAYATPDDDASGHVLTGLTRAIDLPKTAHDPSKTEAIMVWLARPEKQQPDAATTASSWEHKLLFEDDGTRIRSASAAVLLGIDPKLEGGKKRAWLLVTGFSSANMVAVKVDL
ncbi:Serum paraoxonase/arylesterase-like protein [Hapsidospora chrysogenum ATCC 11550]|uniref:Serum paraoxonase/arylesterase-like protein n=1 Tax=Hapsidospora chrysogenum (strain ATCC 11550 / CBS 779.69 / DSM 880 / IAM 14645 / JCM 23072 / IMI 49137) TaxID=857340 RepID=A0A086SXY0_HAPC1|nr:Serum paraoxonase/arylesterase-like protein [Hapsidospora chrysogenum ATCC 11550]